MKASLQSFLTSYLVGCSKYNITPNNLNIPGAVEILAINGLHDSYYIPLASKSLTGLHQFSDVIYKKDLSKISFEDFVNEICLLEDANQENSQLFQKRVLASQEVMKDLTLKKESLLKSIFSLNDLSFKSTEQGLILGHYSHPYPKLQEHSAQKVNLEEELSLKWHLVHKSILHLESSKYFSLDVIQDQLQALYKCECLDETLVPTDYMLFPIHPVQHESLVNNPEIRKYFDDGLIKSLENCLPLSKWIPTTSMRTIYNEKAQWMLKFSLGVRLTNSIRTLQENEVKRGMQLHEVLTSANKKGIFTHEESPLHIIHEPIFMALKDKDGCILKSTIVVLRENPFYKKNSNLICLATLNQEFPSENRSLLTKIVEVISTNKNISYTEAAQNWFQSFISQVVCPLVSLQGKHGIYLGAHQQNLILELDAHYYPIKAYYRDCQGTGYSQYGHEKFKNEAESLQKPNGNVLPVEFANSLMGYYLFINTTLFTLKTIAMGDLELEKSLIKIFTRGLERLNDLNDKSFIEYALKSKFFHIKDNFECCLKNINENTMANPLEIYKKFANPFCQDNL